MLVLMLKLLVPCDPFTIVSAERTYITLSARRTFTPQNTFQMPLLADVEIVCNLKIAICTTFRAGKCAIWAHISHTNTQESRKTKVLKSADIAIEQHTHTGVIPDYKKTYTFWRACTTETFKESKIKGKNQESIQSSTTPDPGYQWNPSFTDAKLWQGRSKNISYSCGGSFTST